MNYKSIFKQFLPILIVAFFASCDKDANEIGADIIGDDNFAFGTPASYRVTAYNAGLGPVSSNNLPVNPLGIYNNSVFGLTKAHFVTQVELETVNPTFNQNPIVDSVTLTVDYFNTKVSIDAAGVGTYEIDSIYGPPPVDTKLNLSIYESGYYMRDLDPVTGERQLFYTNQNDDFFNAKIGLPLNNGDAFQNVEFKFSAATDFETVTETVNGEQVEVEREFGPRMKISLDKDRFQTKFFSAAATGQLVNNNVFKNYFRGLYFHVEQAGADPGNLAMINFSNQVIKIHYTDGVDTERVARTLILRLTGNTASLVEQSNVPADYSNALLNANVIAGDPKLYLKGGQGSMAVIDLFSELGDLEKLRSDNILVNDAQLTFTIDNTFADLGSAKPVEPQRIYLFDLTNNRPIVDYYADQSTNTSNIKFSKQLHDGIIQKSSDGKGTKYRIRLTQHIRGLINNADSTNVKLGLVVTENIMVPDNRKLRTPVGAITDVPLMSIVNPFGTILYGSNIPAGEPNHDKRLKLDIYYTKPN